MVLINRLKPHKPVEKNLCTKVSFVCRTTTKSIKTVQILLLSWDEIIRCHKKLKMRVAAKEDSTLKDGAKKIYLMWLCAALLRLK